MHRVGTVANIARYVTAPDGGHHVIVQGIERFRVTDYVRERPVLAANIVRVPEPSIDGPDIPAEQKQEILETTDLLLRMDKVSRLLSQRIEVLRISQEIGRQTKAVFD